MASNGWERDDEAVEAPAEAPAAAEPVEAAKPTRKRRNVLNEDRLVSAEGLKKIHRTFPYQVSSDVTGREAQALAELLKMYKQWAFDLFPGLNFEDFADRTETLGKGHQVQGLMAELREQEKIKNRRQTREEEEKEEEEKDEEEETML